MSTADGSVTSSFRRMRSDTFLLNSVKEVNSANLYCLIIVGKQRETCIVMVIRYVLIKFYPPEWLPQTEIWQSKRNHTSRKNRSVLELKSVSLRAGAICAPKLALFFANADISLLNSQQRGDCACWWLRPYPWQINLV